MPKLSPDPTERAREEKLIADVQKHDLHVMRVFGDNEWPEFTYSIGLHERFALPEVVILGLAPDLAQWVLNELAARARNGEKFNEGDHLDDILEGFQVTFRKVPDDHLRAHFGWARWYYDGKPFPALQLVYPSTSGVWPWERNAPREFREAQPVLETTPLPEWAKRAR